MHAQFADIVPLAKLQAHVSRLQKDLEAQRTHRHEISEEILHDAKQRLEQLQYHVRI